MATKVKPTIVKIFKKYIRMRISFLYKVHFSKNTIALTNKVLDASKSALFNTSNCRCHAIVPWKFVKKKTFYIF